MANECVSLYNEPDGVWPEGGFLAKRMSVTCFFEAYFQMRISFYITMTTKIKITLWYWMWCKIYITCITAISPEPAPGRAAKARPTTLWPPWPRRFRRLPRSWPRSCRCTRGRQPPPPPCRWPRWSRLARWHPRIIPQSFKTIWLCLSTKGKENVFKSSKIICCSTLLIPFFFLGKVFFINISLDNS